MGKAGPGMVGGTTRPGIKRGVVAGNPYKVLLSLTHYKSIFSPGGVS